MHGAAHSLHSIARDAGANREPAQHAPYGTDDARLRGGRYLFDRRTHDADVAAVSEPYRSLDQFDFQEMGVCEFWQTRAKHESENDPVVSDLPALIFVGSLDPLTPPYYAEQIAKSLSRSQYVLFEGFSHGVLSTVTAETGKPRCAHRIAQAFFDAPTEPVDASCRKDIPKIAWIGAN